MHHLTNVLFLKNLSRKKDNFLVCELEASAAKISSLQGTVFVMEQCVCNKRKQKFQKVLNKNLQTTKIKLNKNT